MFSTEFVFLFISSSFGIMVLLDASLVEKFQSILRILHESSCNGLSKLCTFIFYFNSEPNKVQKSRSLEGLT